MGINPHTPITLMKETNMTAEELKQLFTQWKHDGNLVFVTGAGLSTPSGIKDFKTLDASRILSRYYAEGHRDKFHKWVDENLKDDTIQPNEYHLLLEEIDAPVITQNIDGLHRNLTTLVELHGSISKSKCYCCGAVIDGDYTTHQNTKCPDCAVTGAYDPAIVLYGDDIDSTNLAKTEELLENADKIVVMGTQLHVNPIRSLVYEHASKVVFINDEPPTDSIGSVADVIIMTF